MQEIFGRLLFVDHQVEDGSDRLLSFGDAWLMDLVSGGHLPAVVVLSTPTCRRLQLPGQAMVNGRLVLSRKAAPANPPPNPPMAEAA